MSEFIPLATPNIGGREWEYVRECLDTGWVSSVGSYVTRFEQDFAGAVDAEYAIAVASGTAALHLSLLLAGVRPGDEVVLPSLTFIATANAVEYCGARPVFLDCEPDHLQLSPEVLRTWLEEHLGADGRNRKSGAVVRALLPVHILGHPYDVDAVGRIADEFGLVVVEDAAEALGAKYRGRPVGSKSRLAAFSFNGNKILTTGGGGMVVTSDEALAERARYLSTQAKDDPVRYVHGEIGFNYRLTNVQAAIGCAQLERLDEFVDRKREIAARYDSAFEEEDRIQTIRGAPWAEGNAWMYTVLLEEGAPGPDQVIAAMSKASVQVRPLWQPLHRSPAFAGVPHPPCPVAEDVHARAVSLPCSTDLDPVRQERVINTFLRQFRTH
ncbi:MAG: LegC family aminotransferase [Candidatus Nanopelagicales bacterium]